jgi:hypothetical protein
MATILLFYVIQNKLSQQSRIFIDTTKRGTVAVPTSKACTAAMLVLSMAVN